MKVTSPCLLGPRGRGGGSSEPPLDPPLMGDFLENAISATGDFFQNVYNFHYERA